MGNDKFYSDQLHPNQDTLQGYLDQVLDSKNSQLVEGHLDFCSACQEQIDCLEKLYLRLGTLPDISLNKDFTSGVMDMIQDQKQVSRGITWTLVIEAITAGIILGLIIPALKFSTWIPRLVNTQLEIRTGLNIFLAQLFSQWTLWWAQIKFSFTHFTDPLQIPLYSSTILPSAWIWILLAAGLGLLINGLLLRINYSPGNETKINP
jgi:hypothetical protein